jgi:hypothetical protein
VPGIAAQRAPQHAQLLALAVGGAAHAVGERHHAVHVGEVASISGWTSRRNASAMARAAVAEQFTLVSTPM